MKKYYPQKTTSKLFILCLFALIFFAVYSCRKAETAGAANSPAAYTIDLNALKASYTSDTLAGKTQNFATANNPPTKIITSLNVSWTLVHYLKRATSRVLEFDMQKDAKPITPEQPATGQTTKYYSKTSLVFINFNDSTKMRFFMKVMETVSDSGTSVINSVHYNHIPANFTGRILYYTTAKKIINGYNYVNGKITNGYRPSSATTSGGKTIQSTDKKTLSEYFCINWYWGNDFDGWEYLGTDCYLVTNEDNGAIIGDGGGGNNSGCPVAGAPTQGNPTPTDPNPTTPEPLNVVGGKLAIMDTGNCSGDVTPTATITNNVQDPCLKKMVDSTINKNVNNKINDLIQSVFGVSTTVNLTYIDVTTLPNYADGYTPPVTPGANGSINVEIQLNKNTMPNFSQEYIARVIMHEALHAFMDANNINTALQHDIMLKYVTKMADSLQQMFPGLSLDVAENLSLGGLFVSSDFESVKSELNLTSGFDAVQLAYSVGSLGKRCN